MDYFEIIKSEIKVAVNKDEFFIDDFFKRPVIIDDSKYMYELVTVVDERPDQLSNRFYGSDEYYWTILLVNNMTLDDWPKSDKHIERFINEAIGQHADDIAYFVDENGKIWATDRIFDQIETSDGKRREWFKKRLLASPTPVFPTEQQPDNLEDGTGNPIITPGDNLIISHPRPVETNRYYLKVRPVTYGEHIKAKNMASREIKIIHPDHLHLFLKDLVETNTDDQTL